MLRNSYSWRPGRSPGIRWCLTPPSDNRRFPPSLLVSSSQAIDSLLHSVFINTALVLADSVCALLARKYQICLVRDSRGSQRNARRSALVAIDTELRPTTERGDSRRGGRVKCFASAQRIYYLIRCLTWVVVTGMGWSKEPVTKRHMMDQVTVDNEDPSQTIAMPHTFKPWYPLFMNHWWEKFRYLTAISASFLRIVRTGERRSSHVSTIVFLEYLWHHSSTRCRQCG